MALRTKTRSGETKYVTEIAADDAKAEATAVPSDLTDDDENHAPHLHFLPEGREGHPGIPMDFQAQAYDPDGDLLTFSLLSGPSGAGITANGHFTWTPTWPQLGAHTVTVRVTDPDGLSDVGSCVITVVNQPPFLNPLPDLDAHPGVPVMFTATAFDTDGDTVTFSLVNGPPGATITAGGNFSWSPGWNQIGPRTITVRATDPGGLFDVRSCIITVGNQPPYLEPLADLDAHPGDAVTFTAVAMDTDGDSVTFSLTSGPPGATITGSGNFSWTPTWAQLGSHTISVRATDPGGLSESRSCTITVSNQAPVLGDLLDHEVVEGDALTFTATANDPDGDPLTFSLISPPAGATITLNGNFSWTPAASQVGTHTIIVRVADPQLADVRSCTVVVFSE